MKSINLKVLFALVLLSTQVSAQRWRLGGNTNLPVADDITTPGNNFFGSNAGFNVPIIFRTNGSNRMILDNGGAGLNNGRLALGNNLPALFAPQDRLHSHVTGIAFNIDNYMRFTNGLTNTVFYSH